MPRKRPQPDVEGALLVHKPQGSTSHDVVDAVRRIFGFREVGHLGTLDPLATGVLALLLGRATRLARFYSGRRKRYSCAIRFGFATDTYDADGEAQGPDTAPQLSREVLEPRVAALTGRILQMPPAFSAKKVHGTPAHELARKKKPVELKAMEVEVFEFRILEIEGAILRCSIECSPGTYIRSLAHDLGQALGCGAHLQEIVRTAVGEFTLDQCVTLAELETAVRAGRRSELVIPLERLLPDVPRVTALPVVERRVRHGAKFPVSLAQIQPGQVSAGQGAPLSLDAGPPPAALLRVFNQQDRLIAIAQALVPRTYQPILVLDPLP